MDGGLKQRLVGALVLVALAVIFIPVLLDNQREELPLASRIPQEPAASEVREIPLDLEETHRQVVAEQQALVAKPAPAEAIPEPTEAAAAAETAEPAAAVVEPPVHAKAEPVPAVAPAKPQPEAMPEAEPAPAPAKPSARDDGDAIGSFLRSAWVVQAGVFGNDANARALAGRLKASGFKAFTRKTAEGTRVFIGPELDRGKAMAMLPRVQQLTQVKPMLVSFDPQQH